MDKRDIRLARTDEGWHLTGFLDIETGAKLNTILKNLSVPRDADDDRKPSERRMGALDDICTTVLEHGLPADNGIRPHINVTVTADLLKAMAEDQARKTLDLDLQPATSWTGSVRSGPASSPTCSAGPRSPRSSSRRSNGTSRSSTSDDQNASPHPDKPKPSHCDNKACVPHEVAATRSPTTTTSPGGPKADTPTSTTSSASAASATPSSIPDDSSSPADHPTTSSPPDRHPAPPQTRREPVSTLGPCTTSCSASPQPMSR